MNLNDAFKVLAAAGAVISPVCAVYVAFRDARWRKNGLFAQLKEKIDTALRWHETTEAKVMQAQIDKNTTRVGSIENRLDHTATREDVARLEGSINKVEAVVTDAAAGVDRIESILMKKALSA